MPANHRQRTCYGKPNAEKRWLTFLATVHHTEGTRSLMLRIERGTLGCKVCVEIAAQRPLQTSQKEAQLIISAEITGIRPAYLSTCWALVAALLVDNQKCRHKTTRHQQEPQLSQRDYTTRYVTWNLQNCYTTSEKSHFKRLDIRPWPWKSLNVIGNSGIRWPYMLFISDL